MKTERLIENSSQSEIIASTSNGIKLNTIISHLSDLIGNGERELHNTNGNVRTEKALQLALIAMTEAEKRIDRQQKRIKFLEDLSVTDELTSLLNRRGFLSQLRSSLSIARRNKIGGSLVVLDLDKFKSVNDRFGHSTGDKLLRAIANCLKEKVRETDVIGRLGGDEFAIIMSGLPTSMVSKRIEDIKIGIKSLNFSWEKKVLRVSASIGRCDYSGYEKVTELLDQADNHMYSEKMQ